MEIGLSMVNVGDTLAGYMVDAENDEVGEQIFTNTLRTMLMLICAKTITFKSVRVGDVTLKAIMSERKDGKVSAVSPDGQVLMRGNVLLVGLETDKGPLRSLNEEELRTVKQHIAMLDVPESGMKYNSYCVNGMEII